MRDEWVFHTIAPVYDKRSRVLILGTMPSPKSRQTGFYYGHPQNRFWPVLARLLGRPEPESIEEKRALLIESRIALWDVVRRCLISGADDNSIKEPEPNDIGPIIKASEISAVFTTGAKAFTLYNRLILPKTGMEAIALPSTSPANRGRWPLKRLMEEYAKILPFLSG